MFNCSAPREVCSRRAAIAYPCSGPSVSRVCSTIRSSVPWSTSAFAASLFGIRMEYLRTPFVCQTETRRGRGALANQSADSHVGPPPAIESGAAAEEHRSDQRVDDEAGADVGAPREI